MARPPDPNAAWRVGIHRIGSYLYASTQLRRISPRTGRMTYPRQHWGTLTEDLRFTPNQHYYLAPPEDRARLIFPAHWDLSAIRSQAPPAPATPEPALPDRPRTQSAPGGVTGPETCSRQYGHVMLCEHAARLAGVTEDLRSCFGGDAELQELALALAIYLPCTMDTLEHAALWQRDLKLPVSQELTPARIGRFLHAVTAQHKDALIASGLRRLQGGELLAVAAAPRRSCGISMTGVRTGQGRDHALGLQTLELVAYDLSRHQPVWHRTLQGHVPASALEHFVRELHRHGGIAGQGAVLVADSSYASEGNVGFCISCGQALLAALCTGRTPVRERIAELGSFDFRPHDMEFDAGTGLAFRQYDLAPWASAHHLSPGRDEPLLLNLYLDPVRRCREIAGAYARLADQAEMLGGYRGMALDGQQREALERKCPYFRLEYADDGITLSGWALRGERLAESVRTAGFFANLTYRRHWSAPEACRHYRRRHELEQFFAQMICPPDSGCELVRDESARNGREFIQLVSGRIIACLNHVRLTRLCGGQAGGRFPSVTDMLGEMRSMRCVEGPGREPFLTPAVGRQNLICRAFGLQPETYLTEQGQQVPCSDAAP